MRFVVDLACARYRHVAIAAALLWAGPAHADSLELFRTAARNLPLTQEGRIIEQLQAAQRSLQDVIEIAQMLLASNPVRSYGVDVSAIAGAGFDVERTGADVAAIGSLHFDGDQCAMLRADVLVRGRTASGVDERARASADGSVSACLPDGFVLPSEVEFPLSVFPIRGRGFGALNKTPSLTAARTVIQEPYSEAGFGFWTEGMRYLRHGGEYYWAFPGVTIEQRYHWRGFPTGGASRQEIIGDAYFIRLFHRRSSSALADRSIDIFGFGFHGVQTRSGVAVGEFWPLRIAGLGILGIDDVLLDLTIGVSGTGTLTSDSTVIDSSSVPKRAIAFVHSALSIGRRGNALGITYDRKLDTNLLEELVQEDRGTVWVEQDRGPLTIHATGLLTRALHFPDKTMFGREVVLGGSFDAAYAFRRGLSVGLKIEATHALERDALVDPLVAPDGVRAFVTLNVSHVIAAGQLDLTPAPPEMPAPAPAERAPAPVESLPLEAAPEATPEPVEP